MSEEPGKSTIVESAALSGTLASLETVEEDAAVLALAWGRTGGGDRNS